MDTADKTGIKALEIPKRKITLIAPGAGLMGCDSKMNLVTRGLVDTTRGRILCASKPRARKLINLQKLLVDGAIVLEGHREKERPVFEGDISSGGFHSFVLDGTGGHFVDADEDGGDRLIRWLREHLVVHTLNEESRVQLWEVRGGSPVGDRIPGDPDFKRRLLRALGDPCRVEAVGDPPPPPRVSLLTDRMKGDLRAASGKGGANPLFKVFSPEGSATWLLCSLDDDGDTLWAVCDLGMGCVEYGTVSLTELETTRTPGFKLPMERDRYFDPKGRTVSDFLEKDSLAGV